MRVPAADIDAGRVESDIGFDELRDLPQPAGKAILLVVSRAILRAPVTVDRFDPADRLKGVLRRAAKIFRLRVVQPLELFIEGRAATFAVAKFIEREKRRGTGRAGEDVGQSRCERHRAEWTLRWPFGAEIASQP